MRLAGILGLARWAVPGVGGSNALTVSFGRAAEAPSTAVLPVATYAMTAMIVSGVVSELRGSLHGALLQYDG